MSYVIKKAEEAGVDPDLASYIVLHESVASTTRIGDKDITCPDKRSPFYGKPVWARGAWQLTRCWYPQVSDEEAFDLASSTEIALPLLKDEKTCREQFTTCNEYYSASG